MKSLILLVLSFCFSVSIALAGPNVVVYRYQAVDVKTLPGKIITGESISIDPWIRNDAKWPKGRKTALLVHGFPQWSKGDCRAGMIGLAMHLSQARKVDDKTLLAYNSIYVVEYPTGFSLTETAGTLASIVNERCSDWPITERIDIFAHSMGGLISRAAIECSKEVLGVNNIGNKVSHLVMMGTPQNGFEKIKVFKEVLGNPIELEDMDIKSNFLRKTLNSADTKRLKATSYYVAYGTCSYKPKLFKQGLKRIGDSLYGAHDGLVAVSSSSYDLLPFCQSYQVKAFELNHDYLVRDPSVFGQIDHWMAAYKWFGGAQVAQPVQPTKIEKYTGGLPILLGKTRAEVKQLFGKKVPRVYDHNTCHTPSKGKRLYWDYGYVFGTNPTYRPLEGTVNVIMDFSRYENMDENVVADGTRVHSVVYSPSCYVNMKVTRFVPREILAIKPSLIGIAGSNYIIIIWYIDNKTFCLMTGDSQRKLYNYELEAPEYDKTAKYYLSEAGRNFIACDRVFQFICIDVVVDIFNRKSSIKENYPFGFKDGILERPDGIVRFRKFD